MTSVTGDTKSVAPKNFPINKQGLMRFSKGTRYRMCGLWKIKKDQNVRREKAIAKRKPKYTFKEKQIKGPKNGEVRLVRRPRAPRDYPLVGPRKPARKRAAQKPAPLKKSLSQPGTICILLSGPHAGKRVVFLKHLEKSNQILVTGPYKFNGCPLKRVYPSYVIATTTHIKLDGLILPETLNDDYFIACTIDSIHAREIILNF